MIDSMLKNNHFRSSSVWTSDKKKFSKDFYYPKHSSLNFKVSLPSYVWAIVLNPSIIGILDPFGTLVPRSNATVKWLAFENSIWPIFTTRWYHTHASIVIIMRIHSLRIFNFIDWWNQVTRFQTVFNRIQKVWCKIFTFFGALILDNFQFFQTKIQPRAPKMKTSYV